MELLLIRHAQPHRVELDEGHADPGLTAEGVDQAERLARHLASSDLHAVIASPARRAWETAAPLAEVLGQEVEVDDGLVEFDWGGTYYVPIEDLRAEKDPRWDAMLEGRWGPDGELDPHTFQGRVVAAVETIARRFPSRRVALVCHGGVINAYFGHVLGLEFPLFFEPHYSSISRALFHRDGHHQLVSLNELPHLEEAR